MEQHNEKTELPILRELMKNSSEEEIREAEENLLAYGLLVAETILQESSSVPESPLTEDKKLTKLESD